MKRFFSLIAVLSVIASCSKDSSPSGAASAVTWEEQLETVNGDLLKSFDKANTEFETYHTVPAQIKWNGLSQNAGTYLRLGVSFLARIIQQPSSWHEREMDYKDYSPVTVQSVEPFPLDSVSFVEMKSIITEQDSLLRSGGDIDSRFAVSGTTETLCRQALAAMVCRTLSHYYRNHAFPESVSTSEGSYIHTTSNCSISADEVLKARDAAWKKAGVTEQSSQRKKAEAIFVYARDEWEYEGYSNTKKGAAGTITARAGNCCDMSHAICAMARLSSIPARYFHAQCQYSSGRIGHVISQLHVDGKWEFADATNNSNAFGTVCFTDPQDVHYYETLPF